MDRLEFCDNHCPMPARWVEFPKVDNRLTVDCHLEDSLCPFKDVDFNKVSESEIKPQPDQSSRLLTEDFDLLKYCIDVILQNGLITADVKDNPTLYFSVQDTAKKIIAKTASIKDAERGLKVILETRRGEARIEALILELIPLVPEYTSAWRVINKFKATHCKGEGR
ncbi:hypothetical protein LCGC14_0686730 [marine sediment metagenome]|uniref:Uncharacterized protein n=1 Tax=marine sediment metagenome TaxID=412755 RepID=A0A0F9T7X8_9ZZZZ